MYQPTARKKPANRAVINIHQNSFSLGYMSTIANSRRPRTSLSDLTNMEIVNDNTPRPRPPMARYGTQPAYPVVGRVKDGYRYNGQRGELFLLNVSGVGKWYYRVDGGTFTLVSGTNAYSVTGWGGGVQSKNRVYLFDGVTALSYVDLTTMTIVRYTGLTTPAAPTATASANLISGTKPNNYYYRVTANNVVGESAASVASAAVNVNDIRENWSTTSGKTVTISWSSVTGASGYTLYGGDDPNNLNEIISFTNLTTLTYTDDGSMTLNPYKTAPGSDSTFGPVFSWMYVDTSVAQVFGIDAANNRLYYSAPGTGDFSALNGGGWVTIDDGGDSVLNFVDGFHTGKGDPVLTTSSRGASGKGKLNHITFGSVTYGNQTITFPNVVPAEGQSGTYAPRATVKADNQLIYPSGDAIKSTGTSQNVVNILTTNSVSQDIVPDINTINLASLSKAAGVEYQDRVYFALPVNSTANSEIWYIDLSRKNLWVLRWPVAATDLWLYEDNSGSSHLCALVNGVILEFTREGTTPTTDDGVPFRTRCAFSSLVWDEDGVALGNVHNIYAKLLEPRGQIFLNTYGLSKRGSTTDTGTDEYSIEVSFTGIGQFDYSGNYQYGDDPGAVDTFASDIAVLHVRPKGLLNQLDWEFLTEAAGCDYFLSSVNTRGMANLDLTYKGVG